MSLIKISPPPHFFVEEKSNNFINIFNLLIPFSLDCISNSELMWKQSVWTSLIAAKLASLHLKEGGLVALTGAKAALEGTPGIIQFLTYKIK